MRARFHAAVVVTILGALGACSGEDEPTAEPSANVCEPVTGDAVLAALGDPDSERGGWSVSVADGGRSCTFRVPDLDATLAVSVDDATDGPAELDDLAEACGPDGATRPEPDVVVCRTEGLGDVAAWRIVDDRRFTAGLAEIEFAVSDEQVDALVELTAVMRDGPAG